MQIISTNNYITTNNSFKKTHRTKIYSIKQIPDVPCACCGKKTIIANSLHTALDTITKPLSKLLKDGYFIDKVESHIVLKKLIDFAAEFPKLSLSNILSKPEKEADFRDCLLAASLEPEENFAITFKTQERANTLYNEISKCNNELKNSSNVMKVLKPFKNFVTGESLEIFKQLEDYAEKYPRTSFSQIVRKDEVYKYHKAEALQEEKENQKKIERQFKIIEKLLGSIKPNEKIELDRIKSKFIKNKLNYHHNLRDFCLKLLEKADDYEKKEKISVEISKIPKLGKSKNDFFTNAAEQNLSDLAIISLLLSPRVATIEHVIPRSKGGGNTIDNFIILCRGCNEKRANIPYTEFLKYHPQMTYNTQKQVLQIANFILNNDLDTSVTSFDLWPIRVAKTLREQTNGKINIDLIEYCEKTKQKVNKELEPADKIVKEKEKELAKIEAKKEALQKQIIELSEKARTLKSEKNKINAEYKQIRDLQDEIENFLNPKV